MELPEILILGRHMSDELVGRTVALVEVANPKCLNLPPRSFEDILVGLTIRSVEGRGKWIFVQLTSGYTLLFNTGMGADVLHYEPGRDAGRDYHIKIGLDDGSGFTARVWWFCYLHLVKTDELDQHKMTAGMGLTPLDDRFTVEYLETLLRGRRGRIKSFILNQRRVAGIGNVYAHDILFEAGVHPNRTIPTLSSDEIGALHESMRSVLQRSIDMGGLAYEYNFHGGRGGFDIGKYKVAYLPGRPCPSCGSRIEKITTGQTSSFVCPKCQPID
jgi:formamidopyrimidine-DNA glycosylase